MLTIAEQKEKKQQMVNDWEEVFVLKLEDELSDEGLKKFWGVNTPLQEALDILNGAIINRIFNLCADDLNAVDDESEIPYKIAKVNAGKIVQIEDEEFETEEAAKAKIQEKVNYSTHTLKDFCVMQVRVCK